MWERHDGKMRQWFRRATRWDIVLMDAADLAALVFLECEWTLQESLVRPGEPNYRLLGRIAQNALSLGYLERPSAKRHKAYYDALASGSLQLEDEERIAICSAEQSEIRDNPRARYYLLDGLGRCLPLMILIMQSRLKYEPVEAFRAERVESVETFGGP